MEVAFPVLDSALRAEVRHLLDLERHDNVKARDFHNRFIGPEDTAAARIRSQFDTYEYLKSLCKPGKKRK